MYTGQDIINARQLTCNAFTRFAREGECLVWDSESIDQLSEIAPHLSQVDWEAITENWHRPEMDEFGDFAIWATGGQCYVPQIRERRENILRSRGCSENFIQCACDGQHYGVYVFGDTVALMAALGNFDQRMVEAYVAFILGHERTHFHEQDWDEITAQEQEALDKVGGDADRFFAECHGQLPAEREADQRGFRYCCELGYKEEAKRLWPMVSTAPLPE